MFTKRIALIIFATCMLHNLSYADQLAAKEAVNYFYEGLKAQKARNYDGANSAYQKALLLFPSEVEYRKLIMNNMGIIYAELGDLQTAEKAFMEALRFDPDFQPAKLNLGLLYDRGPDKIRAMQYWLKFLEQFKPKEFVIGEEPPPEKKK